MDYTYNPFTGNLDAFGGGTGGIFEIDGGFANSVYLVAQIADGGGA